MKDAYRKLCESEASVPLFSQAWWLDAVAGDSWQVALVKNGGEVVASMPYVLSRKYGFRIISQPPLTQNQGPWIKQTNAKYAKRLSREKDLMAELIDHLPAYDHFSQNWDHSQTNWLPFYWKGFSQTSRYTYRIEKLGEIDEIWADFQQNVRTDIKKASNRENLRIRDDLPLSDFYALNAMVFKRQGRKVPYGDSFVAQIDKAASARNCRKIFIAEDVQGRHHAGVYLIWDDKSAYYLMGGGDPELRASGATSLCMWEAIKYASTVTQAFDFEGSMLEPVERFFRSFGARQTQYHSVSHTPSRLMRAAMSARSLLR